MHTSKNDNHIWMKNNLDIVNLKKQLDRKMGCTKYNTIIHCAIKMYVKNNVTYNRCITHTSYKISEGFTKIKRSVNIHIYLSNIWIFLSI